MKRAFFIVFLISIFVGGWAFAGAEIFSFYAFPVVNQCHLEWQTGIEDNLAQFVIERSSDGQNFGAVGQVNSRGSYSLYEFTDRNPLMADIERTFYYRLKMLDRDGNISYSEVRDVQLTFSAVQHTWGSIKAMFR